MTHEHNIKLEVRYGPAMVLIGFDPIPTNGLARLNTEDAYQLGLDILNACWASLAAKRHPEEFAQEMLKQGHRAVAEALREEAARRGPTHSGEEDDRDDEDV